MDPINLINFILSPAILIAVIYFFGYLIVKNAYGRYNKLNEMPERMKYLFNGTLFLLSMLILISLAIDHFSPDDKGITDKEFFISLIPLSTLLIISWLLQQEFISSRLISGMFFLVILLFFSIMIVFYIDMLKDNWSILVTGTPDKYKLARIVYDFCIVSFFVITSMTLLTVFWGSFSRIKPNEFPLIRIYLNDTGRDLIKLKKSYLEYPLVKNKDNEYILYNEETDSNIIINKSYVVQAIVSDQKKEEKTKIKTQKDKTKENQPEKSKRKKK